MKPDHLIALTLIVTMTSAGIIAATVSQRARDLVFFLLVALPVATEHVSVHFLSHEWYRGTTRGVEVSVLDVLAISLLAACWLAPRYGPRRWHWPASLGLMLLYFLDCGFSVLISHPQLYGLFELTKVFRGIIVFLAAALFVRTRRELVLLMGALCCAVCFEGLLALKEGLQGTYRVPGSLDHPNSLSMYLCLVGPVLLAGATADFPRWLRRFCGVALGLAAVTVMLTVSRAGIPFFAIVVAGAALWCVSWRFTLRKAAAILLVGAAAGGLLYKSWDGLARRYDASPLEEEYLDTHVEGRGVYLRYSWDIVSDHFLGVGLNNWSYWVSKTYGPRLGFHYTDYDSLGAHPVDDKAISNDYLAAPAHNLAALTAGELGVPGLILFGLLWLRWFGMGGRFLRERLSDPLHRLGVGLFFGLGGIFLQSLTEWVYRQTPIFFTCHVLVGVLAALCYLQKQGPRPPEPAAEEAAWTEAPAAAAERW